VTSKCAAIEKRRQVEREELLRLAVEYKEQATLELMRRKQTRVSGPEIIPHPDDIDFDPTTGSIILNGPVTRDQKMAQDVAVSRWPAVEQEWRNSPLFVAKNPWFLRQYAKLKKQTETVGRLVARRASKINSWDMATPEERIDFARRRLWPEVSKNFPLEFAQSEYCLKSTLRLWLGIEPTKEEDQAFFKEARRVFLPPP
jgi:hypothetical protein